MFAAVARYFGVLSEPTRLKILHTICQDERSVGAIVAATVLLSIVLHGVSGILDLVYMGVTEPNATIIANTVARFVVVAVFLVVWRVARRHHT